MPTQDATQKSNSEATTEVQANALPSGESAAWFIQTPEIDSTLSRAEAYLSIGRAVNLAGPAGAGKTSLAFYLAEQLGRPCVLIHGDDEYGSSDLVGKNAGFRRETRVDNFIHSVRKQSEDVTLGWVENQLTTACREGYTLIYDEFTRSKPQANNVFLSILSEGVLTMPKSNGAGDYIEVHPDFKVIFTSNPEEYAGVHSTQDALLDRMVTLRLDHYDRDTELKIASAKTSLSKENVGRVVDIVRSARGAVCEDHSPSLRATIAICRVVEHLGCRVAADDGVFVATCCDVLTAPSAVGRKGTSQRDEVTAIIAQVLASAPTEEEPIVFTPIYEAEAPTVDEPVTIESAAEQITAEQPTVEQPVLEEAPVEQTIEEIETLTASIEETEEAELLTEEPAIAEVDSDLVPELDDLTEATLPEVDEEAVDEEAPADEEPAAEAESLESELEVEPVAETETAEAEAATETQEAEEDVELEAPATEAAEDITLDSPPAAPQAIETESLEASVTDSLALIEGLTSTEPAFEDTSEEAATPTTQPVTTRQRPEPLSV